MKKAENEINKIEQRDPYDSRKKDCLELLRGPDDPEIVQQENRESNTKSEDHSLQNDIGILVLELPIDDHRQRTNDKPLEQSIQRRQIPGCCRFKADDQSADQSSDQTYPEEGHHRLGFKFCI